MNILILSCGTRNKIVRYFRNDLNGSGRVICADHSRMAPALYEADSYHIVPGMAEAGYLKEILGLCRLEDVRGVLSLIDPELSLLALHEEDFRKAGCVVLGSSYELCEMSLDKYRMYRWLEEHGYLCARSYMDIDEFCADVRKGDIHYPVFVKPRTGSASIAISQAADEEAVRYFMAHEDGLMIQEFLDGQEIGADIYIDMLSGEVVSIFTKKKCRMRAGETDKAVSFRDVKLFELIERFVKEAGYRGPVDIDLFDVGGKYYISEVNPRFGGGYPHAYECGCDHMKLILNNLAGYVNKRNIGSYEEGVYMMKYSEVMVKRLGE